MMRWDDRDNKSRTIFLSYQVEENFETKDYFLSLVGVLATNWTELWETIIKEFPKIKAHDIPMLLEPVEKVNLNQLMGKWKK